MTNLEKFAQAIQAFEKLLSGVKDDQWHNKTPCTEWDVRKLVNHMTYELLWIPDLVAGKTTKEVGDKYEGDVVGDDPKAAAAEAGKKALEALSADGALQKTVHLSFEDTTAEDYMNQITGDITIHSWDLAEGSGQKFEISPELIALSFEIIAPTAEATRSAGYYGAKVEVDDNASEQVKLLALTGRSPDWR